MQDRWGIYGGKSMEELNPYGLRWGDLVVAPDGRLGKLDRPGFKWGYLEGCDRPYPLIDLKPVQRTMIALNFTSDRVTADREHPVSHHQYS